MIDNFNILLIFQYSQQIEQKKGNGNWKIESFQFFSYDYNSFL